jgi:hypothetical protein
MERNRADEIPWNDRDPSGTPSGVAIARGPKIERLRWIVQILDESIRVPGTNFKFGLDALIGLIPGGGDLAGALMSGVIIHAAVRSGVPKSILLAMLTNAAIDMMIGFIPLFGDAFDFAFKANRRNLDLLERYLEHPDATRRASTSFVALVVGSTVLIVSGFLILAVLFLQAVLS